MVLGSNPTPTVTSIGYVVFLGRGKRLGAGRRPRLARLHLKEIASRISKVLETSNLTIDDTSRAHLDEISPPDRQGARSQPRRPEP